MDFKTWEDRKAVIPTQIDRKNFITTHYYKNGELLATLHPGGDIEMLSIQKIDNYNPMQIDEEFLNSFTKIKEENFDEVNYLRVVANNKEIRRSFDNDFKTAVMQELDIRPDHPKAHRLWEMEMDNTRGEGLQRLYHEVAELSELLS